MPVLGTEAQCDGGEHEGARRGGDVVGEDYSGVRPGKIVSGRSLSLCRLSDYLNVSYRYELKTARQPHKVVLLFRTPGGT